MTTTHLRTVAASPVGELTFVGSEDGLRAVLWAVERPGRVRLPAGTADGDHPVLTEAVAQVEAYWAGDLKEFDVALDLAGSDFEREVWATLAEIPYGSTWTYGAMAERLGRPGAARAVGAAIGRNPLSIVLPCHRVVGAKGALTGFAGGLDAKRRLLDHEAGRGDVATLFS